MIEAPQQVGTPFAEIYYPWSEPIRVESHAQGVDWRYEQVVGNIVQQNAGTFVARDHVPATVDDKGGIGLVAFEQPPMASRTYLMSELPSSSARRE
jgi:hypothetical protein